MNMTVVNAMTTAMSHMDNTTGMNMNHSMGMHNSSTSLMNMTGMGHGMDHTNMPSMDQMSRGMGMGHTNMSSMGHGMGHTNMPSMDHMSHGMGMGHTNMSSMDHMSHGMDHTNMSSMDHPGHGMGMDHGSGGHLMKMYFNFDLPIYVLFFGWEITNKAQLAGSCVGIFLLAVLYEGLKSLREYLFRKMKISSVQRPYSNGGDGDDVAFRNRETGAMKKIFCVWHILQSILQIIITTLGMFLMLIYMTFHVWLAVSVSLGSGFGYFFFFWNKKSPTMFDADHCG